MKIEITDEMVREVMRISSCRTPAGASEGDTYIIGAPTMQTTRAALEAVAPLIADMALERAGQRLNKDAEIIRRDFKSEEGQVVARTTDVCASLVRALKDPTNV